jgi:hypothetical protein
MDNMQRYRERGAVGRWRQTERLDYQATHEVETPEGENEEEKTVIMRPMCNILLLPHVNYPPNFIKKCYGKCVNYAMKYGITQRRPLPTSFTPCKLEL